MHTIKDTKLDRLARWHHQLNDIANEMDSAGEAEDNGSLQVLAAHIDSILAEIEYQQAAVLDTGPVVVFRNGTCAVRYADGH